MQNEFFEGNKGFEDLQAAKEWVEKNYVPGTAVKSVWTPIIRLFCELKNVKEIVRPSVFINVEFSEEGGNNETN